MDISPCFSQLIDPYRPSPTPPPPMWGPPPDRSTARERTGRFPR